MTLIAEPGIHYVPVEGSQIAVEISGAGPWVLLLHGIPGDRSTWAPVVRGLADDYTAIVPDMIGFGQSEARRQTPHAAEQAAAMLGLLDALGIEQLHVVGFDFGGPVATLLTSLLGERARSLTLVATNVFADNPIPRPLLIAKVPLLGRFAFRALFGKMGLMLMWAAATARKGSFPLSQFQQALRSAATVRSTQDVFYVSLANLRRLYAPIEATYRRIAVPVLIVWGGKDPFFSVDIGRKTADAVPGSTFVLIKESGHFVPNECADGLIDQLRRFWG